MDRADYLKKAEDCAYKALHATRESDRNTWLKLAEGYLKLVETADRTPDHRSSDTAKRIRRSLSDSSH